MNEKQDAKSGLTPGIETLQGASCLKVGVLTRIRLFLFCRYEVSPANSENQLCQESSVPKVDRSGLPGKKTRSV